MLSITVFYIVLNSSTGLLNKEVAVVSVEVYCIFFPPSDKFEILTQGKELISSIKVYVGF